MKNRTETKYSIEEGWITYRIECVSLQNNAITVTISHRHR